MTKTRVRFHLSKGENFQNWQVKCGDSVDYYDPTEYHLHMINCKLRNQPATAQKIYEGENKTVCAWIECDEVVAFPSKAAYMLNPLDFVFYNPKTKPYWRLKTGENVDNEVYKTLTTQGHMVFITSQ